MRFVVKQSSSVGSAAFPKETLADAVWLALNLIDKAERGTTVHVEDVVQKHTWNEQAFQNLAPTLPAWSASNMP